VDAAIRPDQSAMRPGSLTPSSLMYSGMKGDEN
jgi:hypothetical protein